MSTSRSALGTAKTSDLVSVIDAAETDCVRADHDASLSFRKLQGLLASFPPGMQRSKVHLHKSEKIT
ncbi:hypothetical protein ABVT39_003802 [Epinephelus coioides]